MEDIGNFVEDMDFVEEKNGVRRNKENTVLEIDDITLTKYPTFPAYITKSKIVSMELLEDFDCFKVVSESGNVAYYRDYLFDYATAHSKFMYISTEFPESPLLFGENGSKCIMVCALLSKSVEKYL